MHPDEPRQSPVSSDEYGVVITIPEGIDVRRVADWLTRAASLVSGLAPGALRTTLRCSVAQRTEIRIAVQAGGVDLSSSIAQNFAHACDYLSGAQEQVPMQVKSAADRFREPGLKAVPITVAAPLTDASLDVSSLPAPADLPRAKDPELAGVEGRLEMVDTSVGIRCRIADESSNERVVCRFHREHEKDIWAYGGRRLRAEGWATRDAVTGRTEDLAVMRYSELPAEPKSDFANSPRRRSVAAKAEDIIRELRHDD